MSRPADGWQDRAFCQYLATRPELDLDLTVWFPRGGGPHQWDRAREFCAECVVRAECLEYALALPGLVGLWACCTVASAFTLSPRPAPDSGGVSR